MMADRVGKSHEFDAHAGWQMKREHGVDRLGKTLPH